MRIERIVFWFAMIIPLIVLLPVIIGMWNLMNGMSNNADLIENTTFSLLAEWQPKQEIPFVKFINVSKCQRTIYVDNLDFEEKIKIGTSVKDNTYCDNEKCCHIEYEQTPVTIPSTGWQSAMMTQNSEKCTYATCYWREDEVHKS